jgi:hypothetical protein
LFLHFFIGGGIKMADLKSVVDNIDEVLILLKSHGLGNARLFKGFSPIEEANFNIVVSFTSDKNNSFETKLTEMFKFKNELENILKCVVRVTHEENMNKTYLEEINKEGKSVNLSNSSREEIPKKLEIYFGADWKFNEEDMQETYERDIADSFFVEVDAEPRKNTIGSDISFFSDSKGLKEKKENYDDVVQEKENAFMKELENFSPNFLRAMKEKIENMLLANSINQPNVK